MACKPPICRCGECDIRALQPFIAAFNVANGTDYIFERQLDRGHERKEPEARYVSTRGSMVVERKSLVWPADFAKLHVTLHELSELVADRIAEHLHESRAYKFTFPTPVRIGRRERAPFAAEIANEIITGLDAVHQGQRLGSTLRGREWRFREETAFEREYFEKSTGLKFEYSGTMDPLDRGEITPGLVEELTRLLDEAREKFQHHEDSLRCVVLDPYGSMQWSTDQTWRTLLEQVAIPSNVDEIWLSMHAELTDLACGFVHQRLWPTLNDEVHVYCADVARNDR